MKRNTGPIAMTTDKYIGLQAVNKMKIHQRIK